MLNSEPFVPVEVVLEDSIGLGRSGPEVLRTFIHTRLHDALVHGARQRCRSRLPFILKPAFHSVDGLTAARIARAPFSADPFANAMESMLRLHVAGSELSFKEGERRCR